MAETVPAVTFFACGIECDSLSGLNARSSKNRGCVAANTLKTGTTANAAMEYITRCKPSLFLLENVGNLDAASGRTPSRAGRLQGQSTPSDLDVLIDMANKAGYYMWSGKYNALRYGTPHQRVRIYAIGFRVSESALKQRSMPVPPLVAVAKRIADEAKCDPMPWDHFLHAALNDDQYAVLARTPLSPRVPKPAAERVAKARRRIRGKAESAPQPTKASTGDDEAVPALPDDEAQINAADAASVDASSSSLAKFCSDHLRIYSELSLPWPPRISPDLEAVAQRFGLSRRQVEVIHFLDQAHMCSDPSKDHVFADINMSLGWVSPSVGHVPCLVSTSQIWCFKLKHPLLGSEALALQGFGFGDQVAIYPCHLAQRYTMDLAGNAFNGGVLAALLAATLAAHTWDKLLRDSDLDGEEVPSAELDGEELPSAELVAAGAAVLGGLGGAESKSRAADVKCEQDSERRPALG